MRIVIVALAAVFIAFAALADPVITSVTPNEGPVTGGTTVTIRGTDLGGECVICSPPFPSPSVFFDGVQATSVTFVDATRIDAVTPPHLPGPVSVTVHPNDGTKQATLQNAFTYVGELDESFEAILFPIFMPPVHGAFGSEFVTQARIFNHGDSFQPIFGMDTSCTLIDPPIYPTVPYLLGPGLEFRLVTGCSQSTGRLFYVPKAAADTIAASVRVTDLTRQADSHGVEIPVVRRRDFREDRIALIGVPIDPRFRNTLRIYSLSPNQSFVNVMISNEWRQVPLTPGADEFEPHFAVVTDFPPTPQLPAGKTTIEVYVDTPRGPGGAVIPGTPIWAFITVTNNDTQHITTVTPN